jgi:RNA polymerase sigma-70 factor, ECF subfamily
MQGALPMRKALRNLRTSARDPAGQDRRYLASLLQRAASGDEAAFSELHTVTVRKLRWAVTQVLGQHFDVEDVVQDAYLRIWTSGHQFDPSRSSPITWMTVIARNVAIDKLRNRRQSAVPIENEALSVADQPVDPFEDHDRAIEVRIALSAMTKLAPQRAELLSRAYLQGQSRAALASAYGAPESTIKTWIRRSLADLRQCLEADLACQTDAATAKLAAA